MIIVHHSPSALLSSSLLLSFPVVVIIVHLHLHQPLSPTGRVAYSCRTYIFDDRFALLTSQISAIHWLIFNSPWLETHWFYYVFGCRVLYVSLWIMMYWSLLINLDNYYFFVYILNWEFKFQINIIKFIRVFRTSHHQTTKRMATFIEVWKEST